MRVELRSNSDGRVLAKGKSDPKGAVKWESADKRTEYLLNDIPGAGKPGDPGYLQGAEAYFNRSTSLTLHRVAPKPA